MQHTLTNRRAGPVRVAPWAISQLPVGGTAVLIGDAEGLGTILSATDARDADDLLIFGVDPVIDQGMRDYELVGGTFLPKNRNAYSASPVIVDGRVIVVREDGAASVLAWPGADPTGDVTVLGGGTVEEMTVATPVCVDGMILLRTHDSLWCIGAK